ncbi:hypothetical protein [Vibrio intestinalis]|uniref:hypothetical protein n=1 Tax=Vibrio intestinalis TaxID=2933291 RepID=UPI0021A5271C|nr:hypothetical protein [Vibrio intestinalis]
MLPFLWRLNMYRYLLIAFVLFSPFVNAQLLQITGLVWGDQGQGCGNVGDVKTLSSFAGCSWSYNGYSRNVRAAGFGGGRVKLFFTNGTTADAFLAKGVSECPSGQSLNEEGICEPNNENSDCSATKDQSVDRQWNPVSFGSRPSYCYESCLYTTTEAVCTEIDGIHSCSGTVQGTGETCDADGVIPGGTFPDKNPDPGDGGDTGGGDTGGGDTGGGDTGGGDTGGGDTGGGDTGGGDTGGFDDSGIISKLDSMQIDSNEKLDSLAAKLDAMTTKADSNTTTLETAIKDAANTTKNGFDDLGGKVDGLGSKLDSLGSDVQGVGDKIDGLKNAITGVDVSGVGTGTCWETDSCSSFYKPEYPDGISGVFESHLTDIADKFSQGVIESFNSMDLSNASKPNYVISFDFGALGNFGSYDLFDIANLDALFLFIRIVLLASTVLYCRSLIFGG